MTDLVSETGIDDHVSAELTVQGQARLFSLEISYQGLAEPTGVWAALEGLGWEVPPRPPRPASAIDWSTADEGEGPSLLPWRVDNFPILPGSWRGEVRLEIAVRTTQVLREHGVEVEANLPEIDEANNESAASQSDRESAPKREPSGSTSLSAPSVIMLRDLSGSPLSEPGLDVYASIGPSGEARWTWVESSPRSSFTPGQAAQLLSADEVSAAWEIEESIELPTTSASSRADLRVIIPDAYGDNGLVQRLQRLMGDRIEAAVLQPIGMSTSTTRLGLLLAGDVEAARLGSVAEILAGKYPTVICRGPSV